MVALVPRKGDMSKRLDGTLIDPSRFLFGQYNFAVVDNRNPCFALIMVADDIGVLIGCNVFPAEITGWTPLLCHTFKVARQLHYTQEGAFA